MAISPRRSNLLSDASVTPFAASKHLVFTCFYIVFTCFSTLKACYSC